jgi:hypothetical protein
VSQVAGRHVRNRTPRRVVARRGSLSAPSCTLTCRTPPTPGPLIRVRRSDRSKSFASMLRLFCYRSLLSSRSRDGEVSPSRTSLPQGHSSHEESLSSPGGVAFTIGGNT